MISERWDVKFDVNKLREHFYKEIIDKEITRQSAAFGGWSILSSTGDFKDGWHGGHRLLDLKVDQQEKLLLQKDQPKKSSSYCVETQLCTGYVKEVIEVIRRHNLKPRRARIISLTAGMSCVWHKDVNEKTYAVRLHIPIITNSGCFFETRKRLRQIKGFFYLYSIIPRPVLGAFG